MIDQTRSMQQVFVVTIFVLLPFTSMADNMTIEDLKTQLRQRDKVILELLERVKALEKRVGIARPETVDRSDSSPPDKTAATTSNNVKIQRPNNQAPGTVVVDEMTAERALERSLTTEGALLLPQGYLEIEPSLSFARREDATSFLSSTNNAIFAGITERNTNSLTAGLGMRLGLPWDSQLEIGIPYQWREVEFISSADFTPFSSTTQSGSALGDVRMGFAKTLLRERTWLPDLVGRITWDTDSGEMFSDGVPLSGGFHELRGSLTAIKRQDPIAFVGGLAYEYSFEESNIKPGSLISATLSSFIALSPETSLNLGFSTAYRYETEFSGADISGSDQTLASFILGGSTLLAPGTLLNVSLGIGLTEDSDDYSVTVSLPIRFNTPVY